MIEVSTESRGAGLESGCRGPSLDPTARGTAGLGRGLVPGCSWRYRVSCTVGALLSLLQVEGVGFWGAGWPLRRQWWHFWWEEPRIRRVWVRRLSGWGLSCQQDRQGGLWARLTQTAVIWNVSEHLWSIITLCHLLAFDHYCCSMLKNNKKSRGILFCCCY